MNDIFAFRDIPITLCTENWFIFSNILHCTNYEQRVCACVWVWICELYMQILSLKTGRKTWRLKHFNNTYVLSAAPRLSVAFDIVSPGPLQLLLENKLECTSLKKFFFRICSHRSRLYNQT